MRDGAVGRDEGQHGAHVRVDHAAALADAADAAGLAADGELNSCSLGLGVGGHDGAVCLLGGVVLQDQLRQVLLDALDVETLADHTGGCNSNIGFGYAEQFGRCLCHAAGVLHAVRCAGVRVACISNDSACYAILEVLHGNVQRSRLNAIHRVSGSRSAFAFAENDRGIIIGSAFLDAAAHAARLEAFCGTNAAFDNLHNCFLLLKSEV